MGKCYSFGGIPNSIETSNIPCNFKAPKIWWFNHISYMFFCVFSSILRYCNVHISSNEHIDCRSYDDISHFYETPYRLDKSAVFKIQSQSIEICPTRKLWRDKNGCNYRSVEEKSIPEIWCTVYVFSRWRTVCSQTFWTSSVS